MATDQLINKTQGDAIISGLTAIKNAILDQPVPTQVEDVVADAFDVGVSYVPGDYCIYENKLYICDVAHHGAWDGNDFTLTTVGAVLESLNNAFNNQKMLNIIQQGEYTTAAGNQQFTISNLVSNKIYKFMSLTLLSSSRIYVDFVQVYFVSGYRTDFKLFPIQSTTMNCHIDTDGKVIIDNFLRVTDNTYTNPFTYSVKLLLIE